MSNHQNLNVQPEPDLPPSEIASLSLGLLLGSGVILGAMLGALFGHFQLDDAFGFGQDVLVGAIGGIILGILLSVTAVKLLVARVARREQEGEVHTHE